MATTPQTLSHSTAGGIDGSHRRVIFASSLGTVFEWYDFYLYGSLSAIISKQFFSGVNETTGFIFALLAFAAGFFVRPFGALVFGRLGDLIGRKHTFLITIVIMGASTAIVGMLPSYAAIGVAAPIVLIGLRLLQGLALGGEYGGAATYVAEHAPDGKRGLYTSWIQTTATLGLFLSLLVILICRVTLGDQFEVWGWRIPFLISIVLLGISVYIRLQLQESPAFLEIKNEGKLSTAPLTEAFGNWKNLKIVLLALFGATAGQAVVWYGGQFYALFFLEKILQVDAKAANLIIAAALVIGTPFFVVFGALSDRIGRKSIIMAGCVLAAVTYFPVFKGLTHFANPALERAVATAPVTVIADPADCSFQFDPVGKKAFTQSCDVVKSSLAKAGVPYDNEAAPAGSVARVRIGNGDGAVLLDSFPGNTLGKAEFKTANDSFSAQLKGALTQAGYPAKANMAEVNYPMVIALCTYLVILVTMVYGPIAAWLVELFPTRIRYTSMSLPYHIGNGWFGGFLPVTSFAIVAATGNIYNGLWYPIVVAVMTAIIGTLFLRETKDRGL
ncbi:MFS transporter [Steroidobacter agaridevorans]|uniref:MFS transporter n=1 Tax=Steroidobacter agaridevorans TaxID=2695856 RepID=UPI00132158B3|nr:MFS transporter [Steroidobacter agaridevorans]GFE88027.1 MFS transporter [Steroidobacter agaridevorans]